MISLLRILCLIPCFIGIPVAQALSLGGITGSGSIGGSLDASIPLYASSAERSTILRAELLPDIFSGSANSNIALRSIMPTIEQSADGFSYVRLTSTAPIATDKLMFRVRVVTTSGAVVGHYAVRLLSAPATPPTQTVSPSRRPAVVATPRIAHPATKSLPVSGATTYGPVRSGETLWSIAKHIANGRDLSQVMRELLTQNPQAFVNGDRNRLRIGVTLQTATAVESSAKVVAAASENVDTTSHAASAQAPAPAGGDELDKLLVADNATTSTNTTRELPAVDAPAIPDARPSSASANVLRAPELAARLAALDAKFAAIRAKYGAASEPVVREAIPTEVLPAEHAAEEVAAAPSTTPVASSPKPEETKATLPTIGVAAPSAGSSWIMYAFITTVLVAGLSWGRRLVSVFASAGQAKVTLDSGRMAEAGRKAEVARKAENRVRMESEIKGLLNRKNRDLVAPANPPEDFATSAESTLDLSAKIIAETAGDDRDMAIDANIAHGRYTEAEGLLLEVISGHPRNVQAKLRLAEVYYITEQVEGFSAIATDIKTSNRGDLTDDEWQRVVRMGKIIAPDLVLFSGPKAIGKRA